MNIDIKIVRHGVTNGHYEGIRCRCRTCGHTYLTDSAAAWRAWNAKSK